MFALAGIFAALIITIGANSAYAQSPDVGNDPNPPSTNQDTAPTNPNESGEEDDELSCAISRMGWILCPLIETFASVGDQAFQFLATTFLETEPELVASVGNVEGKSGTYVAWELARNIANILFIIAFLIIILSQVTGRGIDNYGIKKTLPRLVIAAIAVNVSYYICQAMVDLSNILGYEIQNFLVEVSREVSDQTAMPPNTGGTVNSVSGGTLAVIVAAGLSSIALVWILLPIMMLGIGTVVITCIVIIIILLLRKAFIVLLVVASPIAFVAYLLPNTESYFRKWLSMFWKLLMVFPVVGLLFGGGQLASAIILVAGTSNTTDRESSYSIKTEEDADKQCVKLPSSRESTGSDDPNNPVNQGTSGASVGACESRSVPLLLGLVAAGIAVAPLLAVWAVLKGALNGAGAIGGKITGAVDTYTNKGVNKIGDKYKNSTYKKYRDKTAEERKSQIQAGTYRGRGGSFNPRTLRARANSGINKVTGGYGAQRQLMAQAANRKAAQETVDMFNGDYDLAMAWVDAEGSTNSEQFRNLSEAQQEQFKRMRGAGLHRQSNSFLAAAQFLGDSGQGSAETIARALIKAEQQGATRTDRAATWESVRATYRSKGRGDIYGQMSNIGVNDRGESVFAAGAGAGNDNGQAALAAIQRASAATRMQSEVRGWDDVVASSTHRVGAARDSYAQWLGASENNLRSAVAALGGMEGRARTAATTQIERVSGQTISQLRTRFNLTG